MQLLACILFRKMEEVLNKGFARGKLPRQSRQRGAIALLFSALPMEGITNVTPDIVAGAAFDLTLLGDAWTLSECSIAYKQQVVQKARNLRMNEWDNDSVVDAFFATGWFRRVRIGKSEGQEFLVFELKNGYLVTTVNELKALARVTFTH